MTAKSMTLSAAGTTTPMAIDLKKFKNGIGLLVTVSAGATAAFDIEVSGDSQETNNPTHWNKHDTLQTLTASANGNLAFPVTYIRINAATLTGGSVTLSIVEGD